MAHEEQELAALLERITEQTTFYDLYQKILLPTDALRVIYHVNPTPERRHQVLNARPELDDGLVQELTDSLNACLEPFVVDGRFGNGFAGRAGGGPTEVDLNQFVLGLVLAAAIMGPARVASLFHKWVAGGPIHYRRCAILSGLTVEQTFRTGEGLQLERLSGSDEELKRQLPMYATDYVGRMSLKDSTKVSVDCIAGPPFYRPGDEAIGGYWETLGYGTPPEDPDIPGFGVFFDYLCWALSLVLNHSVSWSMIWSECEEAQIFGLVQIGMSGGIIPAREFRIYRDSVFSPDQLDAFNDLFRRFLVNPPTGNLRTAVDRWVASKSRLTLADRLIELRIAMEALFLPKNARGGFRAGVATNGAWYLGTDREDRRRTRDILGRAYRRASSGIHVNTGAGSGDDASLLAKAQDLCRDAMQKRIREGREPDWDELTLG